MVSRRVPFGVIIKITEQEETQGHWAPRGRAAVPRMRIDPCTSSPSSSLLLSYKRDELGLKQRASPRKRGRLSVSYYESGDFYRGWGLVTHVVHGVKKGHGIQHFTGGTIVQQVLTPIEQCTFKQVVVQSTDARCDGVEF